MSYAPKVSIVIPVYNGANYLSDAIDSALAQTYQNIEVIVVNDGSSDNDATEKAAMSYGNKIRYFKKENGGVASALNLGIKNMTGEYFSWLSHDDIYEPTKIEKQVSLIETDKDIILCSGRLMDSEKNPIPYRTKTIGKKMDGEVLFSEFLKGYVLNGLGFLIPQKAFEKAGYFDESMRYLQDLDLWLRLMWYDFRFVCHEDLLVVSRVHRMQTTNLMSNLFDVDRGQLASKHLEFIQTVLEKDKERKFLRLYHLLFVKGNNKVGLNAIKTREKELGCNRVLLALEMTPYRILHYVKKVERIIYNYILQKKGDRECK